MLERFAPAFAALPPEGAHHVASALWERYRLPEVPDAASGTQLLSFCEEVALDQASVVLAMSRDVSPLGVKCIETLVGRPITRAAPPEPPRRAPRGAARRKEDSRVITSVAPNPKRPGSAAATRYALYRVGMTVTEALWLGLRQDDIRHDAERGFITLEAGTVQPEKP